MVTHSRGHMRGQPERRPRGAEGFPNASKAWSKAPRSYWPVSRCVINPFPSPGDRGVSVRGYGRKWNIAGYRLPGEPSLDHPGVPTGRLGHRAGLKTVGGIFRRFFCGLPALPARCSDPGVGARSTGKHRSPQTAPRLQGPNIGSNEPGRSPEVMLDAFRASLTWSVELSGSLRSVTLSLFRAGAGASGVVLA